MSSVAGLDDPKLSTSLHPAPTTVAIPMIAMARRVADLPLERIDRPGHGPDADLATMPIVRGTSAGRAEALPARSGSPATRHPLGKGGRPC